MPKYYCDYCDTYLTHDSPSVRKTHCSGRKHKDNVRLYYQKWLENQAQSLIDATTAAFMAGKMQSGPFAANSAKPAGAMVPPPPTMTAGPVGPTNPGQPMVMMGPPPIGPMPVMGPPAPVMGPHMMVPGMRPPVGHIAPVMPFRL